MPTHNQEKNIKKKLKYFELKKFDSLEKLCRCFTIDNFKIFTFIFKIKKVFTHLRNGFSNFQMLDKY